MADTVTREELERAIEEGSVVVLEALPPMYFDTCGRTCFDGIGHNRADDPRWKSGG